MLQVEAENAIALMNGQWLGRFGRFKKKNVLHKFDMFCNGSIDTPPCENDGF